jgi:hypothetical protein
MAKKKKVEATPVIHGYKGFDKDLKCRGFQFQDGETHKHTDAAKAGKSGFHFCENPLEMTQFTEKWYADQLAKQVKDPLQKVIEKAGFKGKMPAKSKYRNQKVTVDGFTFDSQKEARRYADLLALQRAGKISNLELQVPFVLAPSVVLDGRKKPALRYVADFAYDEEGKRVVEDVKSAATRKLPVYRIKAHLMLSVHGIAIKEA